MVIDLGKVCVSKENILPKCTRVGGRATQKRHQGFIGITWSHKSDVARDTKKREEVLSQQSFVSQWLDYENQIRMSRKRELEIGTLFWVVTSHLHSPLFFIIQITANRISGECIFTYFSRLTWHVLLCLLYFLLSHKSSKKGAEKKTPRKAREKNFLPCDTRCKNHKVDEWSPLSIRGENRINLHFMKRNIFLLPFHPRHLISLFRNTQEGKGKNVKWEKVVIWFSINNRSFNSNCDFKNDEQERVWAKAKATTFTAHDPTRRSAMDCL